MEQEPRGLEGRAASAAPQEQQNTSGFSRRGRPPALSAETKSPETSGEFITLARVVKTQGRRGEIAAEMHSDIPERFVAGMKLFALCKAQDQHDHDRQETRREVEVEDLWPHKGLLVLKFAGVDSISDAEVLIGSELQVPVADRAKLEQGWTYVSDLIGCTVWNGGTEIGRIEDVQFGAGEAPLLIVASAAGDNPKKFDVPFAAAYLEDVDPARRRVRMNLPDGMLEINAPLTPEEKQQQQQSERNERKKRR
jgi:16S rRNA processing protein RimM